MARSRKGRLIGPFTVIVESARHDGAANSRAVEKGLNFEEARERAKDVLAGFREQGLGQVKIGAHLYTGTERTASLKVFNGQDELVTNAILASG
jgi:hypothetical protein